MKNFEAETWHCHVSLAGFFKGVCSNDSPDTHGVQAESCNAEG